MNDRLLSQEDRFLAQYLLQTELQALSNDIQDVCGAHRRSYEHLKREFENYMLRSNTKWH